MDFFVVDGVGTESAAEGGYGWLDEGFSAVEGESGVVCGVC
ncbi:MAG: hypothetical protein NZ557_14135 [Chthonomonadaceae bacterium]|nr:hypothetical protein [Chthonomonadaceae bacterium]